MQSFTTFFQMYKKRLSLSGAYWFDMGFMHFNKEYSYFELKLFGHKRHVSCFCFIRGNNQFGVQKPYVPDVGPFYIRISSNSGKKVIWSLSFKAK